MYDLGSTSGCQYMPKGDKELLAKFADRAQVYCVHQGSLARY